MNIIGKRMTRLVTVMLLSTALVIILLRDGDANPPVLSGVYLQLLLTAKVGWVVGEPVGGYGTILKTTNGGQKWIRQGKVGTIPDVNLACVAAVDNSYAWIVGGGEGQGLILRTTNGGQDWDPQEIPADSQGYELNGIYALNREMAWAVGYGGVILYTSNGGSTWSRQGQGNVPTVPYYSVYASDAGNVWAVGDPDSGNMGTVIRTTDSEGTWVQVPYTVPRKEEYQPSPGLIMVHGADAKNIWVVGEGKVSFTGDGGGSWVDQWTPEMVAFLHINGVFALDKEYIWLARDQGAIYLSQDGGEKYTLQDSGYPGDEILRISAINRSMAWAVSTFLGHPIGGHVLFTADGGQTWISQETPVTTYWNYVSFVR